MMQIPALPPVSAQCLKDRVIVVTGAGQGIGKFVATSYAQHGATVILLGRTQAKLEATYDEIVAAQYPEPLIFTMDLEKATENDYQAMAEGIYQQLGRLDGILHNAAHLDNLSPLAIQTVSQFEAAFKVNVIAPFALTKACLPLLQRASDASVVFTSTSAVQTAGAYWGAHSASKCAADHMVKTWAHELETTAVRLNSVVPGALQSPQRKKTHPGEVHDNLPSIETKLPIYIYLMMAESKQVTGQVF
ncbi:MAG TPA: SDR family NAD(P)-dependent oxidoreductase [Methylophilaceae bacterium]|jgi:NAD(P)-dependent dehydrogenase (short-subunit alcohol dehydrogenase family)